jgi:hypothetical protein
LLDWEIKLDRLNWGYCYYCDNYELLKRACGDQVGKSSGEIGGVEEPLLNGGIHTSENYSLASAIFPWAFILSQLWCVFPFLFIGFWNHCCMLFACSISCIVCHNCQLNTLKNHDHSIWWLVAHICFPVCQMHKLWLWNWDYFVFPSILLN